MAIPEPNVLVRINSKGRASVEVGGVRMSGVVKVSPEFGMDGAPVMIEVSHRFVRYEQAPSSIEDATQQIVRRLADIERHQRVEAVGYRQLEQENDELRRRLAERPRVRVPAGSNIRKG